MKQAHFLSFILLLTLGWTTVYTSTRETFSGVSESQMALNRVKGALARERAERDIERDHFLEFRQSVATLMPTAVRKLGEGEDGYPIRNLAAVVSRGKSEELRKTLARSLFETGKAHFRDKRYAEANRAFRQVADRFGYTNYAPESLFLLSESYFLQENFEGCVATIRRMVEIFPQHELTGFAMVRLGRVFEVQKRSEEAVDIYKTVLRTFPQRDVASQARASLRGIEL